MPASRSKTYPGKSNPPVLAVYRALARAFGPQHWWPARTRFEMMTGAILTQNTSWKNVEKAIAQLKRANLLTPAAMHKTRASRLALHIRSSGYYNLKARRLKHFVAWLMSAYNGNINRMFREATGALRHRLLGVHGIGKETADSMLLYAGQHPVFVVDAYTRRFMHRHGWIDQTASYDEVAEVFVRGLSSIPVDHRVTTYNEYHALIVELAKRYCRTKPDCTACPLRRWLP